MDRWFFMFCELAVERFRPAAEEGGVAVVGEDHAGAIAVEMISATGEACERHK